MSNPVILKMYSSELNATGDCTQEAFDTIYVHRGWELLSPAATLASEVTGRPIIKTADLTNSELRQILARLGVEQPGTKTAKNSLVQMVEVIAAGGQLDDIEVEEDEEDDPPADPPQDPPADPSAEKDKPSGRAKTAK